MFAVNLNKAFQGKKVPFRCMNQLVEVLLERMCRPVLSIGKYHRKGGSGVLEAGYRVGFCVMNLLNGSTATGGSIGSPAHSGRKWGLIAQTKRGNVLTGI